MNTSMNTQDMREECWQLIEIGVFSFDDAGMDKMIDWWLNKIQHAIAQERKENIETIKNSRTINETYGVGVMEDQARMQAIVDIEVTSISKKSE